jgi:transcription antitermination factor NusG
LAAKKRWYAVYTKPRWEKKVNQLLQEAGVECYCPLNKVYRKWSDRMKIVEEPLFKSYVFVRVSEGEMTNVRMITGVVNFVYWLSRPAVIKDREIETIRKFLNEYTDVEVHPVNVQVNSKVRIQRGLFMDREGVVKKVFSRKVQVVIDSIGYALTAYIDRTNISPVESKPGAQPIKRKS